MTERVHSEEYRQLEQTIVQLEAQRAILGDAVVDASIAALRDKLVALEPATVSEQRKQATVLLADVAGFTAMSETMDPEEVSDVMNALWQCIDAAIVEYGGHVDKHIGDAVMALWGVDMAHETDPEYAIRAALAMQAVLADFGARHAIAMRIGLSTGPVLLGRVGATGEFSAIGDAVNLAHQLEGAAPSGGVLISHATYRHVHGMFDVLEQAPLQVKGKTAPVQTYLVQRARPRTFRMETRGVEGIETRMVGRDAELLVLQDIFHDAMEDAEMRVVTVMGEAGMGKSRLLYEFEKWIESLPEEIYRFKGWGTPGMEVSPYRAIRRMFAHRFEILENDNAAAVRDKFRAGVALALEPERADLVGQLIGFDLPITQTLQRALENPLFRERALAGLTQYFETVVHEPTVIFLEDVHWADDSSLDLVNHLAEALPEARLLVVCLARPMLFERRPNWGEGQETHICLELKALSRRESRALVAEILQKVEDIPAELRDLVVDGAEGNPFYVEELIKMLIDDGVIRGGEGRWRVELERLAEVHVPPTLVGVLQARLDSLPSEERALLQRASVVGRLFWDKAVAELAANEDKGFDNEKLVLLLVAVRDRELVFRREHSTFAGTEEYTFKHALLRDVTYETVLLKLRRMYHRQVAAWLEASAGDRLGEYLGLIAAHYELGDQTGKAIAFLAQAGERAAKLSAFEEAAKHFSRGLELLKKLPDGPERTGQELQLQLPLAMALMNLKGFGDSAVGQALDHARALCDQIGETPQIFVALFGLGTYYCAKADYKAAVEMAERILRIAPQAPDPSILLLIGHTGQTANLSFLGQSKQALTHARQFLDIYDPQKHDSLVFLLAQDLKSNTQSWATFDLWLRGYPDQAREMSRDTLARARELAYPNTLIFALNWATILYQFCRDAQSLQEMAEECLALSTEYGAQMWIGAARVFRGWSLVERGQIIEGLAEIQQGLAVFQATGSNALQPYFLTILAEVHGKAGQLEEGLVALDEALACVEKTGECFYEPEMHRLRGELLLARGVDESDVEKHYKQAIEVARKLELKLLELRAAMSLSRLWHAQGAQGKREQARQMLAEIYGWFTEGFDTTDLQEAKALLDQLV